MRKSILLIMLICSTSLFAKSFDDYLKSFTYAERTNMKISLFELIDLYETKQVQIIDIRFKEEFALWHLQGSINIPLNELPARHKELSKKKLIVTVCPHLDRAAIGRHYLTLKGYNAKYLKDGLIKMFNHMRGDDAKDIFLKRSN